MSKGSPKIVVRISVGLKAEIEQAVRKYNAEQTVRPMIDASEWVRRACREKLDKTVRSRRTRRKRNVMTTAVSPLLVDADLRRTLIDNAMFGG